MGAGQHGAGKSYQGAFKIGPGRNIQVVDRLVEQEQVAALCDQAGQVQAGPFTLGQATGGTKDIIST